MAHNFYPTHLWDDERSIEIGNPKFSAHQKLAPGADLASPATYAAFTGNVYAPDLISEQSRAFVRANKDRPFFCYIPTTVPHLALQIPDDSLAEYLGKFPDPPYDGSRGYLAHPHPRAAYAAMVTRMDREIGRLMDLVKELGLERDTLWVFSSDNGPLYNQLGGTDSEFFNSHGGLRGRKGGFYEGGFRVPTLVRWPGRIAPGTTTTRVSGFEDWLPTLLEAAGASARTPRDIDGISLVPTLLGRPPGATPVPLSRVPRLRRPTNRARRRLESRPSESPSPPRRQSRQDRTRPCARPRENRALQPRHRSHRVHRRRREKS